jgi:hypothetical protein
MNSSITDLGNFEPVIVVALKRDPQTWKNFQRFPKWYQRVRGGWLAASRRPLKFSMASALFLKMTAQNDPWLLQRNVGAGAR